MRVDARSVHQRLSRRLWVEHATAWLLYQRCSDWTFSTPPRDAPSDVERHEYGCDRLALGERPKLEKTSLIFQKIMTQLYVAYCSSFGLQQWRHVDPVHENALQGYRSVHECFICGLEAPFFIPPIQIAISRVWWYQITWNLVHIFSHIVSS